MIPFLWIGYGLRFFIEKVNKFAVAGLLFSYGVMYYFWDISYSVYVTPFHIWDADMDTFFGVNEIDPADVEVQLSKEEYERMLANEEGPSVRYAPIPAILLKKK